MACRVTRRNRVAVSDSLSPIYREVIETYCQAQGIQISTVSSSDSPSLDDQTAALVVQYPNFYGYIEDMGALAAATHNQGALFVCVSRPHGDGDVPLSRTLRRGHSDRGGSTLGDSVELRRALSRTVCHQAGVHQANAQPVVRTDGRQPRQDRLRAYAANARAAYSPGTGHQQHLHQRGPFMPWHPTIYLAALGKQGLRNVAELCYQKAPLRCRLYRPVAGGTHCQSRAPFSRSSPSNVQCRPLSSTDGCWNGTYWEGWT